MAFRRRIAPTGRLAGAGFTGLQISTGNSIKRNVVSA
jgi:hypothetical protein